MLLQAGGDGLDCAPDIAERRAVVQHALLTAGHVVASGELIATIAKSANSRAHAQPPPSASADALPPPPQPPPLRPSDMRLSASRGTLARVAAGAAFGVAAALVIGTLMGARESSSSWKSTVALSVAIAFTAVPKATAVAMPSLLLKYVCTLQQSQARARACYAGPKGRDPG